MSAESERNAAAHVEARPVDGIRRKDLIPADRHRVEAEERIVDVGNPNYRLREFLVDVEQSAAAGEIEIKVTFRGQMNNRIDVWR